MESAVSVQPFRIGISDSVLEDLRARLRRTRRVRVFKHAGWDAGTDPDYLDELIRYWRDDFDWRAREREINQLSQFTARIGAANLHFVHEVGSGVNTTPVLLLHGWPDSFLRYRKVIPLLTGAKDAAPEDHTFDVVVPSMPGFAFTGLIPPHETIPSIELTAQLMHRLMTEVLGYARFAVAGGDGGSAVAQRLAIQFPDSVMALHLTDIGWHNIGQAESMTHAERKYTEASQQCFMEDGAYVAVHATQPRALAASLNDSPAGLASWIVDRFHSWADSPAHLEQSFSKDEMLTNITIYWATQTIESSIYGYLAETRQPSLAAGGYVDRPVGLALFPRDLAGYPPRSLAERSLNVVRWTEMPSGGHFGAWERPDEFADDLKRFVVSLQEPFTPGVQSGRAGKAV